MVSFSFHWNSKKMSPPYTNADEHTSINKPLPVPKEIKDRDNLHHILDANQEWSKKMQATCPEVFESLEQGQSPEILWLGCSDSRVAPNLVTELGLGDIFVHRNIGNTILPTDFNALCVMQYAVEHLKVKHIVVCGHYQCGAVKAGMGSDRLGLLDQWLVQIKSVYGQHYDLLEKLDEKDRFDRLCELNCLANFENVCNSTIVTEAVKRGQQITVHAWCFRLRDGVLVPLAVKNL
ncbi:carbonate dehydratase [Gorgonomyces haynaldii]|nr:carbonate dehydratase [Gorgonomyces haynaldii]